MASVSVAQATAVSSTQPISIGAARDQQQRSSNNDTLNIPSLHNPFAGSPMNTSSSSSFLAAHPSHLANPRYAGTSPRSAESSTSWSIHPGPLFISAGSLGSTSGSLGANSISGSAGSFRNRMYPGLGCSPGPVLNPLDPEFKFRGIVGSMESDHDSLVDPHMSQREVEQFRDFTCCGLPLRDLHALVEHFESHHVLVVDPTQPPPPPPHPQSAFEFEPIPLYPGDPAYGKGVGLVVNPDGIGPGNVNASVNGNNGNGAATANGSGPATTNSGSSEIPTSADSSLAGALGPSSASSRNGASAAAAPNTTNHPTGSVPSGFDLDDIDMDMDPEPEHEHSATSPAPSASSSSNHSTSSTGNNLNSTSASTSNRSSPLGGGAGPLPLTQPQRFANANANGGTRSSVSSPPDTPLLTTPVSPFATAPATQTTFPWASPNLQGQSQGDGLMGLASNIQQQQVPAGPPAFDTVTLPAAKHIHGGNGMFAHPYAGASSARRHATHPLSPLSSASTSTATSPTSASSSSTFGFNGQPQQQHRAGLHHTQSLYALRFARHVAEQREREREDLMRRALKDYAVSNNAPGYEEYGNGFANANAMDTAPDLGSGVGGAGVGGGYPGGAGTTATATGLAAGMGRLNVVGPTETAIHPGLLFSNAPSTANSNAANVNGNAGMNANGVMMNGGGSKTEPATARTTPAHSRSGSPSSAFASGSGPAQASTSSSMNNPTAPSSSSTSTNPQQRKSSSSTPLPRPTSSLLLSKPFKCPTPGCTKSYKQANGLKYHVTHGQCSFTPPPELSSISELGLSIGVNLKLGPMGLEGLENMTEAERREAEREAERRLRPFCCQVKPCTRRYKNMNGLRYHYQHSGEHGAIGLRMLASGRHDATREQSVERSDEEENGAREGSAEVQDGNGNGNGNAGERAGSAERGRRRERKDGQSTGRSGQTNSAPSTPGPSQLPRNSATNGAAFSTQQQQQQSFTGFTQQTPFPFQQQGQHQRSLSGSSGGQQPRSPLSQGFTLTPSPALSQAQAQTFAQTQFASMGIASLNGISGVNGVNGVNGMMPPPPPSTTTNHTQFAFAVQSQPASAYASPWGSRAGSPTS